MAGGKVRPTNNATVPSCSDTDENTFPFCMLGAGGVNKSQAKLSLWGCSHCLVRSLLTPLQEQEALHGYRTHKFLFSFDWDLTDGSQAPLSWPLHLQSFLPPPLHSMNLDAAGPCLLDHSARSAWDHRAVQWRWKMGGSQTFQGQCSRSYIMVFHFWPFNEGGSDCSMVSTSCCCRSSWLASGTAVPKPGERGLSRCGCSLSQRV